MSMRYIPYSCQLIEEDDIKEVVKVLRSPFITQGPKIKEFEDAIANYCKVGYAVVFSSGTAALHGAYFAAGVGKGDEIITSPITFAATSNASLYLGGIPVFVDVEEKTGNIDPAQIEQQISSRTKTIVPVDYAGNPAKLETIVHIARKHKLMVVEDACHALGAECKGEKIGSCKYSDMAVLSFHPVKHITTGEGGAVLTNNETFYKRLLLFRTHGITKEHFENETRGDWHYEMQILGYNYRMTDFQAALGISQLRKLNSFVEKRRAIAETYQKVFANNPYFDIPEEGKNSRSSYHLYPIRLKDEYKDRKQHIFTKMREKGLRVQVHYIPVYLHPYYQKLGFRKGSCPLAEDFYQREISIPIFQSMTDEDRDYVVRNILAAFEER